jgi:hypothetical protein
VIIVECYTDEYLVRLLGFKEIKHEGGKGKVLERVRENSGTIGMIDEDPDSNQPSERQEYIEFERKSTIKLLVKRGDESKKVIEISPDLEGWILVRAKKNRVFPKNYGLPNDPHELHSPHIEKNKKFREFMDELVKADDDEILSLKKWLTQRS